MQEITQEQYDALIDVSDEIQDHVCLYVDIGAESHQVTVIQITRDEQLTCLVEVRAIENEAGIEDTIEEFARVNKTKEFDSLFYHCTHKQAHEFLTDQLAQAIFA